MASYFDEFQKQQKALRDAEREKKKASADLLKGYRLTGKEKALEQQQKLNEEKLAALARKESALRTQHGYGLSGKPAGKGEERTQNTQEAIQEEIQNGDTKAKEDILGGDVGGKVDDIHQKLANQKLGDEEITAKQSRRGFTKGGVLASLPSPDFDDDDDDKDADESATQAKDEEITANQSRRGFTKGSVLASLPSPDFDDDDDDEDADESATQTKQDNGEQPTAEASGDSKEEPAPIDKDASVAKSKEEKKEEEMDSEAATTASTCRTRVELDFGFGLIYETDAPAPTEEECTIAAAQIVPNGLDGKKTSKGVVSYDPNSPPFVTEVKVDPDFNQPGQVRYMVKGKIPVFLVTEEGKSVEKTRQRPVVPLDGMLKRHASFRKVSVVGGRESAVKEKDRELIVGEAGGNQWKRVREGAPAEIDELLKDKEGHKECEMSNHA